MIHKLFHGNFSLPSVLINSHQCKACWKCLDACPSKVIGKVNFLWHKHAKLSHPDTCTGCLKCVKICPFGAIIPIEQFISRENGNNNT